MIEVGQFVVTDGHLVVSAGYSSAVTTHRCVALQVSHLDLSQVFEARQRKGGHGWRWVGYGVSNQTIILNHY